MLNSGKKIGALRDKKKYSSSFGLIRSIALEVSTLTITPTYIEV
jgi:hypothetical protein